MPNRKSAKKKLDPLAARKRKSESILRYQENMLRKRYATETTSDYSTIPETNKHKILATTSTQIETKENITEMTVLKIDSSIPTDQPCTTVLNELQLDYKMHNELNRFQNKREERDFNTEKEITPPSNTKITVHSNISITKEEAVSHLNRVDPSRTISTIPLYSGDSSSRSCLSTVINVSHYTHDQVDCEKSFSILNEPSTSEIEDPMAPITPSRRTPLENVPEVNFSIFNEPSSAPEIEDLLKLTTVSASRLASVETEHIESFSILNEPSASEIEDPMAPTTPSRHASLENDHEESFSILNEPSTTSEIEDLIKLTKPSPSRYTSVENEPSAPEIEDLMKVTTQSPSRHTSVENDHGDKFLSNEALATLAPEKEDPMHNIPTGSQQHDNRTSKRRKKNKAYIDFLSDDDRDFSAGSSDEWSAGCESESSDCGKRKVKKRTKKKNTVPESCISKKRNRVENKSKLRKEQKNAGKSYETSSGYEKEEKKMLENPCLPDKCARGCYKITEDRRKALFAYFWGLDVQRRRDWIVRCARICQIKRKKTKLDESRRNVTYEYVINDGEGFRQVCQKFLINTLSITQKYILYTITNANEGMATKDRRNTNCPSKYSLESKSYAKDYIESLPAVPSHYCRARSNRQYLPQEFKNMTNLYRVYSKHCSTNEKEKLSEKLFTKMFKEEYNIGFHLPKKDKCGRCVQAQNNDLVETEQIKLNEHIEEKKDSYKRFKIHQNLKTKDTITVSFDLQKVLNTPHGENMLLYYSRKYSVFNLTFYESESQEGFCFTWGECDGKRGGNEIGTCIYKYLQEVDQRQIKNVLLYCDSCTGQNKNKITLSAIYHFLQSSRNVEVVQLNFLLPGHSYMPVDSMHAVIEREVAKLIVWGPSQWPTYMESSRKRPKPYKVTVLEHGDFIDWEPVTNNIATETFKQIKFKTVRIITLKKKDLSKIEVKYSMKQGAEKEFITVQKPKRSNRSIKGKGIGKGKSKAKTVNEEENNVPLKPLYNSRLPISVPKYRDLKRLCDSGAIPNRFHKEYLDLPSVENVVDALPETDEDDDVVDLE